MSATVQHVIVLLIVAGAAVYLGRLAWATLNAKSNCGCSKGACARMGEVERKLREAGRR